MEQPATHHPSPTTADLVGPSAVNTENQLSSLKVGDFVQFVKAPDEWNDGSVPADDTNRALMHHLVSEQECLEVERIDRDGLLHTSFHVCQNGGVDLIDWILNEETGWVKLPDLQ